MRRLPSARRATLLAAALLVALAAGPSAQRLHLGSPTSIAPGVDLYHVSDPALLDPPAPVSVWLLRVDLARADLRAVLANDEVVDTETVPEMGARYSALAAVNAGFFLLPSGDPSGIYQLAGRLVSDARRPRGAVGIVRGAGPSRLIFGQVTATMRLRLPRRGRPDAGLEVAGVDTTRHRGRLMLFTPAYYAHTDTASGGTEWVLRGNPLRVTAGPLTAGKTPIPRDGYVLSYGGTTPPPLLQHLRIGTQVALDTHYRDEAGGTDTWSHAEAIVGGAGLLIREGHVLPEWRVEQFAKGFAENRHPRTLIGTRPDGSVWLVTVDGRQPSLSAGMSLAELRRLAERLSLHNALNLDGGGSTTMWARGKVVNSPSDPGGPRKVSDALLVVPR